MSFAIITAHPRRRSFTHSVAQVIADGARSKGAQAVIRDLYRMRFDPRLHAGELPDHHGFQVRPDVVAERAALSDVKVFVLVYPLWFNAPPAILKGYVDRVFGMGFGYSPIRQGGNQPLLTGKKLLSLTSSGAPQAWIERSGAWVAMRRHFDDHLAAVTGLEQIGHHNIGGIHPDMEREKIKTLLEELRTHGERLAAAYG
ncbi:MAG: NAD(P)H-dependent oxidoreductase [Brevundimonas sp.]|jgi:NAD(P)H dehydrogenase (quinone)|uniref:NAD(P)H-dependent oxidoreductase n=1 Tax=Brevundimonas sp. Leaf280 TaxID=1736320 RepID=UPI0006FDE366|nr:NAD(P)H-dependent oxidoreductase [Brevundimonas sp. Leaf280]KQP46511.1 NAD(P)H dehydrogenase [Brevundimonas sp. Leaf280]